MPSKDQNQHKDNPNQLKAQKDRLNSYARFSGIAIQMVAIIAVGTFVGVKLDERYPNENNLYTLGCVLFAVVASIVYVIRRIIALSKKEG
ncbi:AtpZ/AtpI family protein [Winogradskyella maritima]|uniref:AtpZ/AtpI family protein n=1 Tax=Winogradskyella maritima TaxID=1517766 RepID=A0ABV8ADI4_9FLAO